MKKTFTYLLGGALFALFLVPSSARATTVTATWDWQNNNPSTIRQTPEINGTTAWIASDQSGISMLADATASGAVLRSNEEWAHVQFNAKTKLQVPVVSTGDVVTVKAHSSSYKGIIIGNEDFDNTNTVRSHTATADDVAQGYVTIESKGGYLLSVQVVLAYAPMASPHTYIIWDWKNGIPSGITTATQFEGASGTVVGSDSSTELTFVSGKFTTYGINTNVQFNKGTIIRVPVTSTSDVIKITQYSNNEPKVYSLLFGTAETDVTTEMAEYQATAADVALGYVQIKENIDNGYLYSLTLQKSNFTTATIGDTGWATFSNSFATDFTDITVNAKIVTGVSGSALTMTDVTGTAAANTGLLLNADEGTYAIPLTTTGTNYSSTNKLVAGTGAAVNYNSGAGYNYVLAKNGGVAVFQRIVEGTYGSVTVAKGKAYLALASNPGAHELTLDFSGGGSTDIQLTKDMGQSADGVYYNLAGQRVVQPTKGLYIVNGKKVMIR